jgi:integrase
MAKARRTRGGGTVRQLSSGRYQARFRWDDGELHPAPETFETRQDATAWLKAQTEARRDDAWEPPTTMSRDTGVTVDEYFERWILQKDALTDRVIGDHKSKWRRLVSPEIGSLKIKRVTQNIIEAWYQTLSKSTHKGTNDTYGLVKQVFDGAVINDVIKVSPVLTRKKIMSVPRDVVVLKPVEVWQVAETMGDRFTAAVLISGFMGLRIGELRALRRRDVNLDTMEISVTRALSLNSAKEIIVKPPKSRAGIRVVPIPLNIRDKVVEHLDTYVGALPNDLLWTHSDGGFIPEGSITKPFRRARKITGHPDMHWHDLRHTAGGSATAAGLELKEVMAILGHSTVSAALMYQHLQSDYRDKFANNVAALDPTYKAK